MPDTWLIKHFVTQELVYFSYWDHLTENPNRLWWTKTTLSPLSASYLFKHHRPVHCGPDPLQPSEIIASNMKQCSDMYMYSIVYTFISGITSFAFFIFSGNQTSHHLCVIKSSARLSAPPGRDSMANENTWRRSSRRLSSSQESATSIGPRNKMSFALTGWGQVLN